IIESEYQKRKDIYTADIYAWVLYKRGEFVKAKELINEAMRLKTKDARILYHAGMIENSLGNKQQARKYLKSALDLNPAFDLIQAKIAKETLEELKKS
ncbi:MAG: thioredoxin, partial [Acidobacteria bacterium]